MVLRLLLLIFLFAGFEFSGNFNGCHSRGQEGPSVEYEVHRRRIDSTTRGLGDYVAGQINRFVNITSSIKEINTFKKFFKHFNERLSMLLLEQQRLRTLDGWGAWREAEGAEVAHLVQRRLHVLQHPKRCTRARKLVCKVEQDSEFGCQIDTLVFCLSLAYGTQRTLVLDSRGWRYHARGWGQVFQPLSQNCTVYDNVVFSSASGKDKVVMVKNVKGIAFRIGPFMPPTIPLDLVDRIVRISGDPAAWWAGQLLAYILRPREHLASAIARTERRVHYHRPIVGLHVRRTDKIEWGEMTFHSIEEYMFYAEYYYWTLLDLKHNTSVRRVYLATEDIKVLLEARRRFPEVQFLSEPEALQRAYQVRVRSQPSALPPLLTDITLLAAADFVVCTFTSHVSRLVYLMMQNNHPDAMGDVHSLDQVFHLNVMRPFDRLALAYHTPTTTNEMKLTPGDLIEVYDYAWPWDKYKYGFNQRTRQEGEFPWFKTKDIVRVYPMPTYAEVSLCDVKSESAGNLVQPTPAYSPFPSPLQEGEAPDDDSPSGDDQYPDL